MSSSFISWSQNQHLLHYNYGSHCQAFAFTQVYFYDYLTEFGTQHFPNLLPSQILTNVHYYVNNDNVHPVLKTI